MPSTSVLTDGDIAFSDSANGSFVPDVGGTYLMNLQVGNGTLTDDDTVKVAALSPNIPPTADAGLLYRCSLDRSPRWTVAAASTPTLRRRH